MLRTWTLFFYCRVSSFGEIRVPDFKLTCFIPNRAIYSRDLQSFPETIRCSRLMWWHFRCFVGISGTCKTRFNRKNVRRGSISKFSRKWSINCGIAYVHVYPFCL